jgi:hypothetical protein
VILLLARLIRFLIVLLLVRFAVRFIAAIVEGYRGGGDGESRRSAPTTSPAETTLVRDRVCDTFVPLSRALVATIGGHEQHFCSAACRDRALVASRQRALGAHS